MKLLGSTPLGVALRFGSSGDLPVGRLLAREGRVWFEFAPQLLEDPLSLSPIRLPVRAGVHEGPREPFGGLHGLFADSLPDAWGRLLLDRRWRQLGGEPSRLGPLDRLSAVGERGLGALVYQPSWEEGPPIAFVELEALAAEATTVLEGQPSEMLSELLRLGGSPGGARPKVLVTRGQDGVVRATDPSGPDDESWLVKFRALGDVEDSSAVELAWHRMARDAGIGVAECELFEAATGPGYFASRRFDRRGDERWHVQTLSGLLEADHRLPSVDAETAMRAVRAATRDHAEVLEMFRRIAFNVLSHNRDDHARQFSLRFERSGDWKLAPAYDLTFADGPGGEHTMAVAGEGRAPGRDDLLRAGRSASLREREMGEVLDRVEEAVSGWRAHAGDAGVGRSTMARIGQVLPQY